VPCASIGFMVGSQLRLGPGAAAIGLARKDCGGRGFYLADVWNVSRSGNFPGRDSTLALWQRQRSIVYGWRQRLAFPRDGATRSRVRGRGGLSAQGDRPCSCVRSRDGRGLTGINNSVTAHVNAQSSPASSLPSICDTETGIAHGDTTDECRKFPSIGRCGMIARPS
jgi:hypothetical protein